MGGQLSTSSIGCSEGLCEAGQVTTLSSLTSIQAAPSFKVKNTFIDGFEDEEASPAVCATKSCPAPTMIPLITPSGGERKATMETVFEGDDVSPDDVEAVESMVSMGEIHEWPKAVLSAESLEVQ